MFIGTVHYYLYSFKGKTFICKRSSFDTTKHALLTIQTTNKRLNFKNSLNTVLQFLLTSTHVQRCNDPLKYFEVQRTHSQKGKNASLLQKNENRETWENEEHCNNENNKLILKLARTRTCKLFRLMISDWKSKLKIAIYIIIMARCEIRQEFVS